MNYLKMFNNMHPGFFDDPGIKGMPKDWVFSELIMDLRNDSPREVVPSCSENITFCEYKGDISKLKKAVSEVDEDWIQYFGERSRFFCAFDRDEVVAFCILSDFGTQDNLNIGGPGCVGTIPKYRGKGIGLELVKRATDLLKKEKYDISWIHYTHLENWYKKLGYETVLKWNSDGIVMEKVIDKGFRGNAYIIKNKEVLLNYSGGFADLANEIPNAIDTRFASASMSKTFVAVGILQLIEAEKLKFEDTIGAILDFDLRQIDPHVTVRQLLNHTSGVPDYYDESVMDDYEALWTDYPNYRIRHNRDMLPLFVDKPMMYGRGERFQYNNSGYVLLAMIIEKISGVDFDVYLKQNVFDRCGMSNTGYYSFDKLPAKCANSYIYCPDTDDYRTNIYSVGAKGTGDGGAFVTVEDIVKFWNGLLEHKLLSEKTVNQMFSKQSGDGKDPEEGYYGFGVWIIDNPKGQDYVYMQGCDDGVSAISEYNPNNGMITVLLSNYGDNVWARMRKIREEMY